MQRLYLRPAPETLAKVEAMLQLAGACAIVVTDAGDQPLLEPPPNAEPLWDEVALHALFPDGVDLEALAAALPGVVGWETVPPQDWLLANQPKTPLRFGRLSVGSEPSAGPTHLQLPPGVGFGTGHHPTTALCLEWLSERPEINGAFVLDYGCGSGILALAALRLGADSALGVDHDPQAVAAAARNARSNRLESRCRFVLPEQMRLPAAADVVLANIVFNTLLNLTPQFERWTRPGGRIVLSGVLDTQVDSLRRALEASFSDFEVRRLEEWCLLAATRRTPTR